MMIPRALGAIVLGGVLCALFDGICATLHFRSLGVRPVQLWQTVASGLLGPDAFQRGWSSGALGVALHCLISFAAATCFVLASRRMPSLVQHYVISGISYGILVFLVMNLAVVPMSLVPKRPLDPSQAAIQLVIHMFVIGLSISASAAWFLK